MGPVRPADEEAKAVSDYWIEEEGIKRVIGLSWS